MKRWEYLYLTVSHLESHELNCKLNELGQKGWELVAIFRDVAHFKKPTIKWSIDQTHEHWLAKLEEQQAKAAMEKVVSALEGLTK